MATHPVNAVSVASDKPEISATASQESPSAQPSDEDALAKILDELTAEGAIGSEEKRVLMEDLRAAKRENWPLIVRQFRAALAYREQLAARERQPSSTPPVEAAAKQLVAAKPSPAASEPEPMPARVVAAEPPAQIQQQVEPTPSYRGEPLAATSESSDVMPSTGNPLRVLSQPPQLDAEQASYVSAVSQPRDWQAHLQDSIEQLQATVPAAPVSTDEVNEHMRLRLLQLLAGGEEAALQPIPGATAAQQDYWNKQLFAVSTFLDSDGQPDDKRRAASSLMHLDQARAKLAELATLQVRKLAFVDAVDGYGAYQLHEETQFRPGDEVTLYAEVENFSSVSTEEGYRTRLGTSYEVVDKSGKRIDSAQFPEVEDLCRTPRRDFHMQYTITLPTRIYPEKYEIRLILTDQQSQKIGQASVSFEIVE